MKTVRLYYQDAYIRNFSASVLSCEAENDRYAVVLDRTAFFPEGGGQAADTGTLDDAAVLDVRERGDVIIHYTDRPLSVGVTASCAVDWPLRFRRMQEHTGEHIISGLVHTYFGFENVGFHLGDESCTVDFDGELSREALDQVEDLANRAVWDNRAVTTIFPSPEELPSIQYRSKLDLTADVRLVVIDGIDICACCAPHVSRTGEIGVIKILDHMRHRGGTRLWLKCGADALADYRSRYAASAALSQLLNVPQAEIVPAAERFFARQDALKYRVTELERRELERQAAAIVPTEGDILLFADADDAGMRILANAGMEKCGGVCAVFSGESGDYRFVMGSRAWDMRGFVKDNRENLALRGGGQERMVSGRCGASKEQLNAFFTGKEKSS